MKLLDKRADQQYCIDEAAAEVALCSVPGFHTVSTSTTLPTFRLALKQSAWL